MYIDEWFSADFYRELPLGYHTQQNFCIGQFFWTHAFYTYENLELWRPVPNPSEPTKTIATNFRIMPAGQDAFARTIPLHVPKLETNEEFVVLRAKKRPVLLIQPEPGDMGVNNRGYRGKVQRKKCLVAQIFGLADTKTLTPEFNPKFVERIRQMEFPQLLFLPQKRGLIEVDSVLRLDELQMVFTPHLEAIRFALGEDMQNVLRGQLQFFFSGTGPNDYTDLREMLLKN